jgi:hypothetical protein
VLVFGHPLLLGKSDELIEIEAFVDPAIEASTARGLRPGG